MTVKPLHKVIMKANEDDTDADAAGRLHLSGSYHVLGTPVYFSFNPHKTP